MERNRLIPWLLSGALAIMGSTSGGIAVDLHTKVETKNEEVEHIIRLYGQVLSELAMRCEP